MIPIGGHIIPTSIAGDSDESKYDQKNQTKIQKPNLILTQ